MAVAEPQLFESIVCIVLKIVFVNGLQKTFFPNQFSHKDGMRKALTKKARIHFFDVDLQFLLSDSAR